MRACRPQRVGLDGPWLSVAAVVDRVREFYGEVSAALYRGSLGARASAGFLTSLLAGVGVLVAAVGVYGAVAFAASRRSREIGIRLAIGADRSRVLRGLGQELTGRSSSPPCATST
jgi:ABC-type antimicrobial peptide transport system permease subunit